MKFQVDFKGRRLGSGRPDSPQWLTVEAESVKDVWLEVRKKYDITKVGTVREIPPPPPRMTDEDFVAKQSELLTDIPTEFHSGLSYYAYEKGHSSGYEEVIYVLTDLLEALRPAFATFAKNHVS